MLKHISRKAVCDSSRLVLGCSESIILDTEEMITAYDTQDFVPFGREYVQQHPGKFQIQVKNMLQ